MYQRPDAPLSIGGVLDDGFRLTKAAYVACLPLSIIGALIGTVPQLLTGNETDPTGTDLTAIFAPMLTPTFMIATVISSVVSLVIMGALITRINGIANNREISNADAFKVGLGHLVALFLCGLLYFLAIILGSFLLVIPGIILSLSLAFCFYLVVVDDLGTIDALKKSHDLVWGNWWRTAVILSVLLFIMLGVYMFLGLLTALTGITTTDPTVAMSVGAVIGAIFAAVVTPITYCFALSVFYDLKLRNEGSDLAARIEAVED